MSAFKKRISAPEGRATSGRCQPDQIPAGSVWKADASLVPLSAPDHPTAISVSQSLRLPAARRRRLIASRAVVEPHTAASRRRQMPTGNAVGVAPVIIPVAFSPIAVPVVVAAVPNAVGALAALVLIGIGKHGRGDQSEAPARNRDFSINIPPAQFMTAIISYAA
jgi:hypothetical protein